MRRGWRLRRTRVRFGGAVVGGLIAGVVLWVAGVVWFSQQIPRRVEDRLTVTDAIVVLTGGAGRLSTGLELLADGRARKLFVSGVHRGVDEAEILSMSSQAPEKLECCVELGHSAVDTAGNARETARWMATEEFRSLRLVTASYHMPRSLAEFRRAMAEVALVPHPVFPDHVHIETWWRSPGTAVLIASEFTKYLLSMVLPARPAVE